jgi:peptidyl-dipeptidase Dcp
MTNPFFENTFPPLERSGQLLSRVEHVFHNQSSSDSSDFRGRDATIEPLLKRRGLD